MGLDDVMLILAVEEEFGIEIPDAEAEQCVTVEKLVNAVLPKLRQSSTDPCRSQQGFYIIRRILMKQLALKRSQIKLDTKLDDIIEPSQRHEIWCRLIGADPSIARPLARPTWLSSLVFGIGIIPAALVCICLSFGWWLFVIPIIAAGVCIAVIAANATNRFKTEFPCKVYEVRDLIRFVAPLDSRMWTKEDVFLKIREITAEIFGVNESEINLETDYVKDLGC